MSDKDVLMAKKIAYEVSKQGGNAYFVGGYVRDLIRGESNKDIDIEVHGITPDILKQILNSLGSELKYGASFGIYGLKGYNLDIAMPRKEQLIGKGHRDFEIVVDPFIGTKKAAERRDFTVNSLMQDILTGEVTDHFGGLKDIENKIIRHVNDNTFGDDSLRVLRAAQFAARFEFSIAPETINLCKNISLSNLSKERIEDEVKKALLKADRPSLFFENLRLMDKLGEWFPEVSALIGVEQNIKFHPEGDVWNHTMITLDAAAKYREKVSESFSFMLLGLCHDMGKSVCSVEKGGIIHSYGHEIKGLPLVEKFIRRLTSQKSVINYLLNMTKHHMKPYVYACDKSSIKATNKMFDEVSSPADIIYFSLADNCLKKNTFQYESNRSFLFERLEIFNEIMSRPYVMGKDLIDAGYKPNEHFKEALIYSHKLRLAGVNKETALKEVFAYCKKFCQKVE